MPKIRLYLDDLTPETKNYSVAVKVIEKARPKCWPRNGTLYQNLLLEDEKGNKMRSVLFGLQVDLYKHDLIYSGRYEISNAPIKSSNKEQDTLTANRKYVMVFNRLTDIQSLDIGPGPNHPNYQSICEIPKESRRKDRYDIIGIVVFVEDKPHTITTQQGKKYPVRELAIVDNSTDHPLLITAWNDLTSTACDMLFSKSKKLQIVGFTALKISSYKGFSMATTVSTTVIPSPTGTKPSILADWRNLNRHKLTEMHKRIQDSRRSFPNKHKTTIAALDDKKKYNTSKEEKYILKVRIIDPSFDNLTAYIGCSECETEINPKEGDIYYCRNCLTDNVLSLPRVTFNCQVTDGTGKLAIKASTIHAEKILQMQAADIFRIVHTGNYRPLEPVKYQLQTAEFTMVVGSNPTPATNVIHQWKLETVEAHFCNNPTEMAPENLPTPTATNKAKAPANNDNQKQPGTSVNNSTETPTKNLCTPIEHSEERPPTDDSPKEQTQTTELFIEKKRKVEPHVTATVAETNNPKQKGTATSTDP